MSFMDKVKAVSKVIVGVVGFVVGALAEYLPIVPDQYKPLATAVIAVATAVGIYHAPYAPLGSKNGSAGQPGGSNTPPRVAP